MVGPGGEGVSGQVSQHHDEIRTHPVGNNGHQDRDGNENQSTARGLVVEIGEQHAHHHRGNQIAHAAARLDDRPVARGNDELQALAEHRNATQPQGEYGELGCPLHHLRHKELTKRHREEQKSQRKRDAARRLHAEHRNHHQHQQRCKGQLRHRVSGGQIAKQPDQRGSADRPQHPGTGARHLRRQCFALPPNKPGNDRRHRECVGKSFRARPDGHHGHTGFAVQQQHTGNQSEKGKQHRSPSRGDAMVSNNAHAAAAIAGAPVRWQSMPDKWASQL